MSIVKFYTNTYPHRYDSGLSISRGRYPQDPFYMTHGWLMYDPRMTYMTHI